MKRAAKKNKKKKAVKIKKTEDFLFRRKVRFFFQRAFKLLQLFLFIAFSGLVIWIGLFGGNKIAFPYMELKSNRFFVKLGLGISDVEIDGNKIVRTQVIVDKVLEYIGNPEETSIVLLGLSDLENEIKEIGWIDKADIRKKFPGSIFIKIIERKPTAIWQNEAKIYLSDSSGNLITDIVGNEYLNLPVVVGKDSKKEVPDFFDIISSSAYLYSMVDKGKVVGNRRFDIILENGVTVRLPEKDPKKAWKKLAEIEKEKNILSKDIQYIDLRIEGQVVTGLN
ncbi:MAG TPA: hypothetical protein DIV86_06025 [Alphaproteobacteria bacterium]|nr:hypothetical protein [Alphaproteobacteria bacterium]